MQSISLQYESMHAASPVRYNANITLHTHHGRGGVDSRFSYRWVLVVIASSISCVHSNGHLPWFTFKKYIYSRRVRIPTPLACGFRPVYSGIPPAERRFRIILHSTQRRCWWRWRYNRCARCTFATPNKIHAPGVEGSSEQGRWATVCACVFCCRLSLSMCMPWMCAIA